MKTPELQQTPSGGSDRRLVGRCLCDGPIKGYQGPIKPRPDDLIYRGGHGIHAEYQCPRCFGMWEPSSPNNQIDNNQIKPQ